MCSEIDERTRENPEGAMVHHGYPPYVGASFLEIVEDYDRHRKRMAQQYPGAWPWPVSITIHNTGEGGKLPATTSSGAAKPGAPHFDAEAHRAFMRGLG